MVDYLFTLRKYVKYRLSAGSRHDVHSPFVYELMNDVILDETPFYGFELIESLRSALLLDNRKIVITDFGTGKNSRREKVSEIARKSVKPGKYAQLLFRLVNRFSPEHTLELGTSLGITTLYLSLPKQQNQIITLEGCPETAALALANFRRLKRTNIELLPGEFSDTLPLALKKLPRLDLVYFDGNHRKEPTLNYFETCLPQATEDSIFIFDDIHWDPGMESAWEEIKKHHRVSLTIDLFELGLVFFRRGMVKQDFVLKY